MSLVRLGSLAAAGKHLTTRMVYVKTVPKLIVVPVRNCGWTQDWMPAPYPKTKEERIAAAAKYNLIPEDYKPFPDGSGYGDYPDLPPVGQDARDPYEDFDYYYRRRNFGETVHIEFDTHMSEKGNPNVQFRYPIWVMFLVLMGTFSFMPFIRFIDWFFDLHSSQPLKPKQFWSPGVVHYTFEPLD